MVNKWQILKEKYHANLMLFQNPKCLCVSRNINELSSFLVRDRVGRNGLKVGKC